LSPEDYLWSVKICAPVDFHPRRRARDKSELYYFWDSSAQEGERLFGLGSKQIVSMKVTSEEFEPEEFLKFWHKKWFIRRSWGQVKDGDGFLSGLFKFGDKEAKRGADRRKPIPKEPVTDETTEDETQEQIQQG
jgi:hypothetical protein